MISIRDYFRWQAAHPVVECAPLPPYLVSQLVLHFSSVVLYSYISSVIRFEGWGGLCMGEKLQFTSNLISVLLNYLLGNNVLSVERHKNGRIFHFFHLMPSKGAHTHLHKQALSPSIAGGTSRPDSVFQHAQSLVLRGDSLLYGVCMYLGVGQTSICLRAFYGVWAPYYLCVV